MGSFDPMEFGRRKNESSRSPFIVSMSPPGYLSAWLRPRSARFRLARQNHCNSATSCRFSTSGLPVTPPEPRPARPESWVAIAWFRQLSIRQALGAHWSDIRQRQVLAWFFGQKLS